MRLGHRLTIFMAAALGALTMLALPGIAAAKDRNHDRIPDRWEKRHRLSLKVKQTHRDQDRDHLRNRAEFLAGDDPRDADSDDDGVEDGEENAGTIQSFDAETGRLVIDLFGNDTVSGLVTEETEIECEHEHGTASASHEGEDTSGEEEPGDEHGEEELGDHHGEDESGDDHGDHSGPGGSEDEDGDADENDEAGEVECTTAALVPGAVVEEAELKIATGSATFEEVELGS
jgi:hypothetical protein